MLPIIMYTHTSSTQLGSAPRDSSSVTLSTLFPLSHNESNSSSYQNNDQS